MRVGAIVQARFQSTRLPGKVLMPLPFPDGKPLLKHIFDAILQSNRINYSCIATSTLTSNDAIENFANAQGINCFRGSEDDVLSRFISIARKEELDVVIRLTADNPLVAIKQLEETLDYHLDSGNDYTETKGLPLGMNFEIVTGKALIELANKSCSAEDKEHVTKLINENDGYRKSNYPFSYPVIGDMRCTIDYPSDYAMLSMLISRLEFKDLVTELIDWVDKNRWIKDINNANHQIKFFKTLDEEFSFAQDILTKYKLENVVKFLNTGKAR